MYTFKAVAVAVAANRIPETQATQGTTTAWTIHFLGTSFRFT